MNDLTEAEAAKLFNDTSKALRENDPNKLTELMEQKEPEEALPIEEEKTADEPEKEAPQDELDDKESEKPDADKASDKKDDVPDPSAKTDQEPEKKEEAKAKELTEAETLKLQVEKLSKENHGLRSQAGRVPGIQRKLKDLDKKLEELRSQQTSPSSQPSTKIKPKVLDLLKGISDTDPELANAIATAIAEATDGAASDALAKDIEQVEFLRNTEAKTYQDAEAQRLLEMYPNAPEVFKSTSWTEWKAGQTVGWQRMAESDSADEVADAFEKYAKDMITKHPELAPKVETPKEEPTSKVDAEATERARKIEEERRRKKETAANVSNPSAAGKVNIPDDPIALFNKYSEEIRKQRTG